MILQTRNSQIHDIGTIPDKMTVKKINREKYALIDAGGQFKKTNHKSWQLQKLMSKKNHQSTGGFKKTIGYNY